MSCETCPQNTPRRTPWRVRLSYVSTKEDPLWTVFRYDETYRGAGHPGYIAVISLPKWSSALEYIKEHA